MAPGLTSAKNAKNAKIVGNTVKSAKNASRKTASVRNTVTTAPNAASARDGSATGAAAAPRLWGWSSANIAISARNAAGKTANTTA